jgi:cellulose synthase/poly-beta-1,6-N-acetylglucosamine synthase-like glycosyltransferase
MHWVQESSELENAPDSLTVVDRTITLVIPVKNEERRLPTCFEAIRAQTVQPTEIIVVDGHSTDRTVEVALQNGARVFYEEFRTRGGACQVGVEHASGDFVVFTDADCVPEPDWIETLAKNFEPNAVGVGGRIENAGDTFLQRSVDAALDTVVGSANSVQGRPFASRRFVTSISGCNSMYRRSDLLAVGGFNTSLITTEDTELNRRLLRQGHLLYVPEALVHHRHERGLRSFAKRMFQYGYGRGQSLLLGPPLLLSVGAAAIVLLSVLRPDYLPLVLGLYAIVLLGSAGVAAVRRRNAGYLGTLPIVLVIEHASYIAGFWYGMLHSRVLPRHRTSRAQEDLP